MGERSGEWEWQAEAAAARTTAVIALGVEWIPTTRRSFSTGASRFGGADAGNAEADQKLPGFPIRCGSQDSHLAQGVENRQSPIFSDMSFLLTLLLSLRPVQAPRSEPPPILSADSVRALVAARVGHPRVPGIVVGRIAGAEMLRVSEGEGISGSTLFEIGSITKAFTGVLLADMVVRGEVALDDPVAKYLPPGTRVPERDGIPITLRHLATHTSGLPRLPDNLAPQDWDDPYADYDAARLVAFLAAHQLRRKPGASYEYSNLGGGLLGFALAHRTGASYGELLRKRIFEPLGMGESGVAESGKPARTITGHNSMGEPVPAWHFDALAGAGALHSTLEDMLGFAAAARDTVHGPLARAMALSQRDMFRVDSTTSIGLGWHRRTRGGRTLIWHNGGTGGFRSMLVVDPGSARAGLVLANSALSQDELGLALLDPAVKVPPLPPARTTVPLDSATLARYPGQYRLAPNFVISITPRGQAGLYLQATGQQRLRLYPSSATEFFLSEVAASIRFEMDSTGRVATLVLHQNGVQQRAVRER